MPIVQYLLFAAESQFLVHSSEIWVLLGVAGEERGDPLTNQQPILLQAQPVSWYEHCKLEKELSVPCMLDSHNPSVASRNF